MSMSWVWIAGVGAIAAYFCAWAVFFNRAQQEPEPKLRTVLTEALAFYAKMTFVFMPMVKPGLGVSFVRVVPIRENRSLLSKGRDREPDQAPDQAQAAEKTDGPAKGEPGEPPA